MAGIPQSLTTASGIPISMSSLTDCGGELPQNVVQNAAMLVVVAFLRCVDPDLRLERCSLRRRRRRSHGHGLSIRIGVAFNIEDFLAGQPKRSASSPSMNCSGRTPMPIRFERWIRS